MVAVPTLASAAITITCPANITKPNDLNLAGAVVTYPAPTVTGTVSYICSPASGSFYPVGTTTATCTASATAYCTFTITVNDTQAPTITAPANITVTAAPGLSSAIVIYPAPTVADNVPTGLTTSCVPASGSGFQVGKTTVTCTATDAAGNKSTASFTVTVLSAPILPIPSSTYVYYVPHVVSGGGFVSKISIHNLSSTNANLVVNFISQSGDLLSGTTYVLAPAASMRVQTSEDLRFGPSTTKWAAIGSDVAIGVNELFELSNVTATNVVNTIGFNDAPPLTAFTLPIEFEPNPPGDTGSTVGMALANASGSVANITLALIDATGKQISTANVSLGAYSQVAFDVQTKFPSVVFPQDFVGTLQVNSTAPVSAIALGDDHGPFFSTPPVNGVHSGVIVLPHIVSGDGFLTKLTLMNFSAASNDVTVTFLSQSGQTLRTQTLTLAPYATGRITTPAAERFTPSTTTWATVAASRSLAVNLFFELANSATQKIVNTIGFNDASGYSSFAIPVEFQPNARGSMDRTVGLALANPGSSSAVVTLSLVDATGKSIASQALTLSSMQQQAVDLGSLANFRSALPAANFTGAVRVTSTAPVYGIALGDDFGPFFATPPWH